MVSSCGTSGLFSSGSAPGVRLVPCQVCRTIVCLSYKLPGASPRALLLGGSYSSCLVACRCLAPACHAWLVEVCLCMTLSCKDFLLKKMKKRKKNMKGVKVLEPFVRHFGIKLNRPGLRSETKEVSCYKVGIVAIKCSALERGQLLHVVPVALLCS
jgi:hypothetical protein